MTRPDLDDDDSTIDVEAADMDALIADWNDAVSAVTNTPEEITPAIEPGRRSIATLRRWGLGWRAILLCIVGLHGTRRPLLGTGGRLCCARCGAPLPPHPSPDA